jgi:23S rRNA pseudouridine1911/1915/1917 synthase
MEFEVEQTERLDKFLAHALDVSRVKVQKAIREGKVSVNNEIISEADFKVKPGNIIVLPEFESDELKPSSLELNVVFENDDVAVIDKPAGLVVHPGAGNTQNTLAQALLTKYPGIEKVGEPHRPGIVHRLDEDTSGLILIAKNQDSYEYFKKLFLDRKVEKEYLALVHGVPAKIHDVIDLPIQRVPLKQKMRIGLVKIAQTEYWVLESALSLQYSLLRVKLHTGRTHQIRIHLTHIGHPIVGDQIYGNKDDTKLLSRQFLHAYKLKFQSGDGTWIELESELPEDLKEALYKVGINYHEN